MQNRCLNVTLVKPSYLREYERWKWTTCALFPLHKTDASAPLAQPQAANGVRYGAEGGVGGERWPLCLSLRQAMHSSTGTRAAWGLTWLTTDITPPPFMAGRTVGAMVIQAEKCQSTDAVRVRPSTHPFLSLLWCPFFFRSQSLKQFCAFQELLHGSGWRKHHRGTSAATVLI